MGKDIYRQFLKLTGFEDNQIPGFLPEWRKACEKLRLTDDDVRYAVRKWIPQNFEIQLEGVRKTLGIFTAEMAEMMKAKEKKERGEKLIYGVLPAHSNFYYAMKKTDPGINTFFMDANLASFLNPVFHKISPLLEFADPMHSFR